MEDHTCDATGWEFRAQPRLVVTGTRTVTEGVGEGVEAWATLDLSGPVLRARIVKTSRTTVGQIDETPNLRNLVEEWANEPENLLALIDQRHSNIPAAHLGAMILPEAKASGKKSDSFYGWVLIYQRMCEDAGLPYSETLARENDVSPNTVYRWVAEAKRRRITIDDDEVGQVRKDGEPLNVGAGR